MATNLIYYYVKKNATPSANDIRSKVQSAVTALEQMRTINAEGGLRMWIALRWKDKPNDNDDLVWRRHFAWNPISFRVLQFVFAIDEYATIPSGAVQYDQISIGGTNYTIWHITTLPTEISLPIFDENGTLKCQLKADTMQGEAVFNVAPVVRNWFSEKIADPSGYDFVVKDTAQYTKFKLNIDGGTMREYFAQNAVSQAGEDGDKDFKAYHNLTQSTKLVSWISEYGLQPTDPIYPRMQPVVSILNRDARTITYNGTSLSLEARAVYRFYVANQSMCNELNTAFSNIGLTWEWHNYFDYASNESCNPYPIRWLNRKGGYEQYLFLHREFKTKESKTTGLREVYTDNTGTQISNRKPYAVDGSRSIKVGAERISAQELDILTKMPYSPQIEWYDTAQDDGMGVWSGVSVSKFSYTEQTDATCHDFEIELECPAINMQFE